MVLRSTVYQLPERRGRYNSKRCKMMLPKMCRCCGAEQGPRSSQGNLVVPIFLENETQRPSAGGKE